MAFSLVANAGGATSGTTATTGAIDTTGADLIIVNAGWHDINVADGTLSDSASNTWTLLTKQDNPDTTLNNRLFYCVSPTTSATHTFTYSSGVNIGPSIEVQAWSGVDTADAFEAENGNAGSGSLTTIEPGSVTPAVDGSLVLAGLAFVNQGTISIDDSFTISNQQNSNITAAGQRGSAMGYLVQDTAAAVNPTWSTSGSAGGMTATIAVFNPAGAGGGAATVAVPNANTITLFMPAPAVRAGKTIRPPAVSMSFGVQAPARVFGGATIKPPAGSIIIGAQTPTIDAAPAASGGLAYRNPSTATSTSAQTGDYTLFHSHTVASGTSALVVSVNIEGSLGATSVSGITWQGDAFTHITSRSNSLGLTRTELWYLKNPATGGPLNIEISIDVPGAGSPTITSTSSACIEVTGDLAASTIGATNSVQGSDADHAISLTSTADGSLLVSAGTGHGGDTDPFTPAADTDEVVDSATGTSLTSDHGFWLNAKVQDAGTYDLGSTASVSDGYTAVAVEFLAGGSVSAPGASTITLSTPTPSIIAKSPASIQAGSAVLQLNTPVPAITAGGVNILPESAGISIDVQDVDVDAAKEFKTAGVSLGEGVSFPEGVTDIRTTVGQAGVNDEAEESS